MSLVLVGFKRETVQRLQYVDDAKTPVRSEEEGGFDSLRAGGMGSRTSMSSLLLLIESTEKLGQISCFD